MRSASQTVRKACLGMLLVFPWIGVCGARRNPIRSAAQRRLLRTRACAAMATARRCTQSPSTPRDNGGEFCASAAAICLSARGRAPPEVPAAAGRTQAPAPSLSTTAGSAGHRPDAGRAGIVGQPRHWRADRWGAPAIQLPQTLRMASYRFLDLLRRRVFVAGIEGDGYENLVRADLGLNAGDVVTLGAGLTPINAPAAFASRLPGMPELGGRPPTRSKPITAFASYAGAAPRHGHRPGRRPPALENASIRPRKFSSPCRARWKVAMPEWNRYRAQGEYPFVRT